MLATLASVPSVLPGFSADDAPFATGNNDPYASSSSTDALFVAPGWQGEQGQYQAWNQDGLPSAADAAMSYGGRLGIGFDGTRASLFNDDDAPAAKEEEEDRTSGCPSESQPTHTAAHAQLTRTPLHRGPRAQPSPADPRAQQWWAWARASTTRTAGPTRTASRCL